VAAVTVAVDAARATEGLVHPLLGRHLVSVGYDRDFALLADVGPALPAPVPDARSWERVGLNDDAIRVPAGTALDLGATGKAFAADLVAATLTGELTSSAIVSVGGDLAVAGPDGDAWPISVTERPGEPGVRVWLERGGLATSSTGVRRWTRAGAAYHHLLDPRTGLPVPETWSPVTCLGRTAVAANTASTAAVVLGLDAPGWLSRCDVAARLVRADGTVVRTGGWPADVEEAA
jgi:thiamine biosynthesis lipoprotein